jgi:hypothetical protein
MFVRPDLGVVDDDFLRDSAKVMGQPFEFVTDEHPTWRDFSEHVMHTYPGPIMLQIHDDYGDPVDFPIGKYRFDLGIQTPGGPPGESEGNAWRLELMRKFYDGLVATGHYDCMLVYDLYKVMATNAPLVTDPREYPED